MTLSRFRALSASQTPPNLSNTRALKCDECAEPLTTSPTIVLGFGHFHPDCVEVCPCGWLWPQSLLLTGEVTHYCGGCAIDAGRDQLA